jgi:hypothetical protein
MGMNMLNRLKELYEYNPENGLFYRKVSSSPRWKAGQVAGTNSGHGYIKITIDGKQHYAHRLAWLYVYGDYPEETIDHINGNGTDNRICNLRAVKKQENNQNIVSAKNKSGFQGVSWNQERKRWIAQISINNKSKRIGRFKTKEAAFEAYLNAKKTYHPFAEHSRICK